MVGGGGGGGGGGGVLTSLSVRGFIRLGQLFEGRLIWEEPNGGGRGLFERGDQGLIYT